MCKPRLNTKIHYIYRDAANYKLSCDEVVSGSVDEEKLDRLLDEYPMDDFYPANIGFKAPTFVTEGHKPYLDDPDSHEIVDFEPTTESPTVDMTIEEFIAAIEDGTATTSKQFDLVLKEKPLDNGLTVLDISEMVCRIDTSQTLFPLDIQSEESSSSAIGFITHTAFEKIDYDEKKLLDFLRETLFCTDSSQELKPEYHHLDLRIHLSR